MCKKYFNSDEALKKHEHSHKEEGDWNCVECSFQTNSKQILNKHKKCAHEISLKVGNQISINKVACKFCNVRFDDNQTLLEHRQSMHKTFKPCKNMLDCKFQNDCFFNHSKIDSNSFICYECGKLFPAVSDLMNHRKNTHEKRMCKRFLEDTCNFANDKCWYSHKGKEENFDIEMKSDVEIKSNIENKSDIEMKSPKTSQLVFQNSQETLAPPGQNQNQPTMAMWLQMKMMMEECTKMMAHFQKIVQ